MHPSLRPHNWAVSLLLPANLILLPPLTFHMPLHLSYPSCLIPKLPLGMIILPIDVNLELGVACLGITFHFMCIFGLFVGDEDLFDTAALAGRVRKQLALARVLEAEEQERCLVDGLAHGQEAVVTQDAGLVCWAERFGDLGAFLGREDHAAERVVHGVGFVEFARVLGEHFDGLAEHGPRLAVGRVRVADGGDVGAGLMHLAVDEEAGGVGRAGAVPANNFAVQVHGNHVAGFEEAEVHTEGWKLALQVSMYTSFRESGGVMVLAYDLSRRLHGSLGLGR